ncbi:Fic family protein [Corynebacterium sp. NPDC060344]|uniref:Fic family protein n=1 Tax=Corynebacterium sp. NPDC060344 TaxID=3347101 RepID=UPI0036682557
MTFEKLPWSVNPDVPMSARARARVPSSYESAVVPSVADAEFRLSSELAASLSEASAAVARFDAGPASALVPFAPLLLRSESSASSRIERLTASARALVEAEFFGMPHGDVPGPRIKGNAPLIVANAKLMAAAASIGGDLGVDGVLAMHDVLLRPSAPDIAGTFRRGAVWIGGSDFGPSGALFVPPKAADVPGLVDDLLRFMTRDDLPAIAKAAIAHAQFETIHPFADGNGRTGRALIHVVLADAGLSSNAVLPLSARLLRDTGGYFDTLNEYREGRPEPIVELFARAAIEAAELGTWAAAELESIRGDWHGLATGRAGTPDGALVDALLAQPVMDIGFAADVAGCSPAAARRSLERLESAGIVIGYQAEKRRRAWRAPDVLDLMDRVASGLGRRDHM